MVSLVVCTSAARHLMKFFLFHSSATKEVSARRDFVVLEAQKEMSICWMSRKAAAFEASPWSDHWKDFWLYFMHQFLWVTIVANANCLQIFWNAEISPEMTAALLQHALQDWQRGWHHVPPVGWTAARCAHDWPDEPVAASANAEKGLWVYFLWRAYMDIQ